MSWSQAWPALEGAQRLPDALDCGHAVWGKVHGAPTDFRWIARSEAFAATTPDLPRQLNLGSEDLPGRFQAWRCLGERCLAIAMYPSRAVDAAARRGFLEKQVLEWHRPPDVPAALGALLLLPAAAGSTDEIWWGREISRESELAIARQSIAVDESSLAETIERGRRTLRETVTKRMLELMYDQLLARRRPAVLCGLLEPLPAEAVAALLLPLPRTFADSVSIAGWIPSGRPSFDELGTRWDIVIAPPEHAPSQAPAPSTRQAMEWADALLGTQAPQLRRSAEPARDDNRHPQLRPGMTLSLREPRAESGDVLKLLWDFARRRNRRWLDPRELHVKVPSLGPESIEARLLCDWVAEVEASVGDADAEQWSAKVDLLRSATIVLVPNRSTWEKVGLPRADSRVPALLFGLMLQRPTDWDRLFAVGEPLVDRAIRQSLLCRSLSARSDVRKALHSWRAASRHAALIQRALNESP